MGALAKRENIVVVLLLILIIVAGLAVWSLATAPAPTVRGSPPELPSNDPLDIVVVKDVPLPTKFDEDADEIDPEACLTVVQKITEGPILIQTNATNTPILLPRPFPARFIREQTIVTVIQACNVDDEIRPPNLDRDLDTDIEVFSIICEKAADLGATARCEALRVAQDDNFESSHIPAPAPEPPSEPAP